MVNDIIDAVPEFDQFLIGQARAFKYGFLLFTDKSKSDVIEKRFII